MQKVKGRNTDIKKLKCLKCNRELTSNDANFYSNINSLFSSDKLEVCKKCIINFIGEDKYSPGYLDRVKLVLALMDRPYIDDLWKTCESEWSQYIRQISSLPNYKGKTFADSINYANRKKPIEAYSEDQVQITEEELKRLQLQWGRGFEVNDYIFLENQYDTLINSYECDSYAQEMLFQEIAHQRLAIQKNREEGKPTEKELKTLQDLLGSSNIKPVQETGANAVEQATFGTLIKKYENEHPIPEPDPIWKDVDGIKKYISIWFLGHLCRMMGINNDYSKMYDEEIAKYSVEEPKYEDDDEGIAL